jgi:alkanesulfonate monooxygenase SsuD/methylene tetrahydromethanopterin reductase-like flavin-dependent oxidoreductase (luciferase family)
LTAPLAPKETARMNDSPLSTTGGPAAGVPAVKLFCWHFMSYPYLPDDFQERYETGWIKAPNALWDRERAADLYQEYIDQLVLADELGFDGVTVNEHHQTIYGLMPSPNLIAAALAQSTRNVKIAVIGNLLPLRLNPMRVAEEYAMLDNMTGGRMICGFAVGAGQEAFNYDVPQPQARTQFWEGIDLIARAWTEPGPFAHEGRHYPLRYANCWPLPVQRPHPPIWIPGGNSRETIIETARRGYAYFLSSRAHGAATRATVERFAEAIRQFGGTYHPFRFGVLISVYVGETDEEARRESREGIWYFLEKCLHGHLRRKGRFLTAGPGAPSVSPASYEAALGRFGAGDGRMLGDVADWDELEQWNSIIVGSPKTVRDKLWSLIEQAGVGNFLVQFHFGNMSPEITRKSMRLFATEVAPYLRAESAKLFARQYPALAETEVA